MPESRRMRTLTAVIAGGKARGKATLPALLSLMLAIALFSQGCAPVTPSSSTRPDYEMSPRAEATFNYLKYQHLRREGSPEQALKALRNATELDPSPDLFLEQARHHWRRNQSDRAKEAVRSGLQAFPGHGELVRYLARIYVEQEELDNATSLLSAYLQRHEGNPEAVAELANVYLRKEKYRQAERLLRSVPSEKRSAAIHGLLGQALLNKEKPEEAIRHLRQAVNKDPNHLEAWAKLGYALEQQSDFSQAKEAYSTVLRKGGDSPEVLLKLIELNLKLNNPQRAMELVRRDPAGPEFFYRSCSLFMQSDMYQHASRVLELLPDPEQKSPQALYYKAVIALRGEESTSKAMGFLQEIPSSSELYPEGLLLQSRLLFREGDRQKALDKARTGRKDYPGIAGFWVLEGRILLRQDQPERAREALLRGLKETSGNQRDLLFQLGIAEQELGRTEQALGRMETILDQEPENASALNFIGYTLVEEERDLDRAGELIRQALELEPGNAYYLDSLAWYYYKTQQVDQAWETIQKAVSKVDNDPTIWEHYADIARDLNKVGPARKAYQRALELEPKSPDTVRDKLKGLSAE